MSKREALQYELNVASVLGTVREDVMKALVQAEVHPALAKVIVQIHDSQFQLDKRLQDITRSQVELAKLLDMMSNQHMISMAAMEHLAKATNTPMTSLFKPEDSDEG